MCQMRNIIMYGLAALLVLMIGMGSGAHAMSKNAMCGTCENIIVVSDMAPHAHGKTPTDHMSHGPDIGGHDMCNMYLCHVLTLLPNSMVHQFVPSKMARAWHVILPVSLARADTPDRPPNL